MIYKILFFVLITLIATALLAVFQQKIGLDFDKIVLPQLAPMIAFFIMALLYKNLRVPIGFHFDKVIILKSLLALVVPFFLIFVSFSVGKLAGLEIEKTSNLSSLFSVIIVGMLIGAIGEELGWRSFLQPILERKNSVLISSIIVGLIWGMWHILGWLLRNSEYNIVIATAFHLSINIGFFTFFRNALTNPKLMLINGIVWGIFAMGMLMVTTKIKV